MTVAVTLSGGGARAAAFGYGVLDGLRQTRFAWNGRQTSLLDEIDVISGVSGGSIVAAYYAAFGARTFPQFEQEFLFVHGGAPPGEHCWTKTVVGTLAPAFRGGKGFTVQGVTGYG